MAVEQISGRYDVMRRLGAGGMGDVWLANDTLLGRPVAIKFVGEKELRENPGASAILSVEAKNAGQLLGHPQILSVLDLISVDTLLHQGPAIILEYVDGCNVGEWIATHSPSLDEFTRNQMSLFIALEAIDAIQIAHKAKILHRDIKPQNIMLSKFGHVKVADFGLSRVVEEITRSHTVWGHHTPLYCAPEQWNDEKPDEKTDTYQLSASLYHLFAGTPANTGTTMIGLMRWHDSGTLSPSKSKRPSLDSDVADTIDQGLAKSRDDRPDLWRVFDAVSNALMKADLEMKVRVGGSDEERESLAEDIAILTEFRVDQLLKGNWTGVKFPHAQEAIREGVAAVLRGAEAKFTDPTAPAADGVVATGDEAPPVGPGEASSEA